MNEEIPLEFPCLRVRTQAGDETTIPLSGEIFTIGRMRDNDLKVADAHVSRRHAEIQKAELGYRLVDQSSKTGTFVNGQREHSCLLNHGDRITLGSSSPVEIVFLTREQDLPPIQRSELTSIVTTSVLKRDSATELQQVARFLEGMRYLSAAQPHELLDVVVDLAVEISGADRGFLALPDKGRQPLFRCGRDRTKENLLEKDFRVSRSILQAVLERGERVILTGEEPPPDVRNYQSVVELGLRTVVCLPLWGMDTEISPGHRGREVIGALYLDSIVTSQKLSTLSEGLLESLADDASHVLINMELLKGAREKEFLEMELEMAREIQESLLPEIRGTYDYFEASAENRPSRRISGDYFDLIQLPNERYAVVIADVSGKGVSAAILTSLVQGALCVEVSRVTSPAQCLRTLNRFLVEQTSTNRFVSLFLGILAPDGVFTFASGGHNPPFLVRAGGEAEELHARGVVLGVLDAAEFEDQVVTLQSGDVLCLYTDGVTEAQDWNGDFFGEEQLKATLVESPRASATATLDDVLNRVAEHIGNAPVTDDLTLLVIRQL